MPKRGHVACGCRSPSRRRGSGGATNFSWFGEEEGNGEQTSWRGGTRTLSHAVASMQYARGNLTVSVAVVDFWEIDV